MLRKHRNEAGLLIAVSAVVLFTAIISDSYRQKPAENAQEILRQTSILGIFALGAATVILSGGIDLSSGSVIAFSATICTSLILLMSPQDAPEHPPDVPRPCAITMWLTSDDQFAPDQPRAARRRVADAERTSASEVQRWKYAPRSTYSPDTSQLKPSLLLAAFGGTLLAALVIGSFHAWLITSIGLPPFVATLASLVGLRSLARLLIEDATKVAYHKPTGNSQIYVEDAFYHRLGTEWWIPLLVFVALAGLLALLLNRTVVGRHLYAMGGNEQAARLSGIRTDRLKWLAYCIGTVTAAIAGILHSSYISMAEPVNDGLGFELSAIAAAVVGGCSLAGGIGSVPGVMLGALFLRVVIDSVSKTFKQKPDLLEGLVVGILVVLAVAFNELRSGGGLRKQFFPGALGVVNLFVLTLLAGLITSVTTAEDKFRRGTIAAAVVLVLLVVRKLSEVSAARKLRR